jgi:hypothetical protein
MVEAYSPNQIPKRKASKSLQEKCQERCAPRKRLTYGDGRPLVGPTQGVLPRGGCHVGFYVSSRCPLGFEAICLPVGPSIHVMSMCLPLIHQGLPPLDWWHGLHAWDLVLGNWAKTLHPRNVGFAEFVNNFMSHLRGGKLCFARRKHSWRNPDESHAHSWPSNNTRK